MKDELLIHIKNGDQNAFASLHEKYSFLLYNFCQKYLHSKTDAEEIVQETFMVIWENREKIDPEQSISSYLISIAKHKIFDTIKHKFTTIKHREGIKKTFREVMSDEEKFLWNEIVLVMIRSMEHLPPRQREVLILRSKGYSNGEISEMLRISRRTVEGHVSRAIVKLRSIMGPEDITLMIFIWILSQ